VQAFFRHRPRRDGSAWLAQEVENICGHRSRLINIPDRISERPLRGGLSFALKDQENRPAFQQTVIGGMSVKVASLR
jgi:hypothetical protein